MNIDTSHNPVLNTILQQTSNNGSGLTLRRGDAAGKPSSRSNSTAKETMYHSHLQGAVKDIAIDQHLKNLSGPGDTPPFAELEVHNDVNDRAISEVSYPSTPNFSTAVSDSPSLGIYIQSNAF